MHVNVIRNGCLENAIGHTNRGFPAHLPCSLSGSLGGNAGGGSARAVLWMSVSSCAMRTSFTNHGG